MRTFRKAVSRTYYPTAITASDGRPNADAREVSVLLCPLPARLDTEAQAAAFVAVGEPPAGPEGKPDYESMRFQASLGEAIKLESVRLGVLEVHGIEGVSTGAELVDLLLESDDPEAAALLSELAAEARRRSELPEGVRRESPKPSGRSPP